MAATSERARGGWMKLRLSAALCAGLALLTACEKPPEPKFKTATSMAELMTGVIDPAADVIWGAAGHVITAEGDQDLSPTTEAGWTAVVNAATTVSESGNLLLLPGRAKEEEAWTTYAQQLTEAGAEAKAAALAKNKDAVFAAGGKLYEVCLACHEKYVIKE
jgi:hypothetical protein